MSALKKRKRYTLVRHKKLNICVIKDLPDRVSAELLKQCTLLEIKFNDHKNIKAHLYFTNQLIHPGM